jgi:Zn-dependent protease with chaperone function
MPQFSDSHQPHPSANPTGKPLEIILEAGLAAIEKKKYSEAIAKLEAVCQGATRQSVLLRAQMGLVKAYEGNGEFQQSYFRCKELLKSSNEPTRRWAEEAMQVLKQRYMQLPKSLNHLTKVVPPPKATSPVADVEEETLNDGGAYAERERYEHEQYSQQEEHGRSPFLEEPSTLVDPLAVEELPETDFNEASTLGDAVSFGSATFAENEATDTLTDEVESSEDRADASASANGRYAPSDGSGADDRRVDSTLDNDTTSARDAVLGRDDALERNGAQAEDFIDSTGFVPLDDAPSHPSTTEPTGFILVEPSSSATPQSADALPRDLSDGSEEGQEADSTGFMPMASTAPAPPSPSTTEPPPSTSIAAESTESSAVQGQASFTADLEANPFTFDLDDVVDDIGDAPDGMHGADAGRRDDATPQFPIDRHTADALSPDTSAHETRADGDNPVPSVDPELAAALNVTLPRKRKRTAEQPEAPTSTNMPPPERARSWRPLKPIRQLEFWLSYGWTAIALVVLCAGMTQIALWTANPFWRFLQRFVDVPRWRFLENQTLLVMAVGLILCLVMSQWVLSLILRRCYGVKPLPDRELERRSPETTRLLKRTSQQKKCPSPCLRLVPSQAPFVMSYGLLPRTSTIVVSQGVLTQLDESEIAALYAAELGHIQRRTTLLLMLITTLTQLPFLVYRYSAAWGDRRRNAMLRGIAVGISSAAYGLFWLGRWPGLWLSRTRQVQGDRFAVDLTGNPNGRVLALSNVVKGMAQTIERNRSTELMLAGFDMLMPVSPLQALSLGSVAIHSASSRADERVENEAARQSPHPMAPFASLLYWDVRNPHRQWLTVNNTHPTLGDRIQSLNRDAERLRLRPSVVLSTRSPDTSSAGKTQPFWLQIAPYLGPAVGLTLAIILWIGGGIADAMDMDQFEWLWKDMSLLYGCIAIGFSFGTLMRVNRFFPDISPSQTQSEASLPSLMQDAQAIPLNSVPVTFEGRILGRSDLSNGMGQDLMLRTSEGTIKLHWMSPIGPFGNLMIGKVRPASLIGRSVSVTGWFRRGATVWIDVEKIRADGRTLAHSSHPLWSTLLAIAATLWGCYVIYRGSL